MAQSHEEKTKIEGEGDTREVGPPVPLGEDAPGGPTFIPLSSGESLSRGASIGRYLILGVLGEGGMGRVYSAFDPQLDRKVALKVILPGTTGQAQERLLREARAMAKLSHPNVVMVHDAGTFGAEVFVAMEYVEGQTLGEWLKEKPRDVYEVLRVFRAAGAGLGAAHAAGLMHRDFKPANVLVGKDGKIAVTDFGLARNVDTAPPPEPAPAPAEVKAALSQSQSSSTGPLTQAGMIVGTPHYMAPEQFLGGEVDASVDQFAFCVALFEAVYWARPFPADSPEELLRKVTRGDVAEPVRKNQAPRWLYEVLLKGLATRPEFRFPNMEALLAALQRDDRLRRRRTVLLGILALLVLAMAAGWLRLSGARARACEELAAKFGESFGPALRTQGKQAFETARGTTGEAAWLKVEGVLDGFAGGWRDTQRRVCAEAARRGPLPDARFYSQLQCLDERRAQLAQFASALPAAGPLHQSDAVEGALGLAPASACLEGTVAELPPKQRAAHQQLRQQLAEASVLLTLARPIEAEAEASAAAAGAKTAGLGADEAEAWMRVGAARASQAHYEQAEAALVNALLLAEQNGDAHAVAVGWVERAVLAAMHQQRFPQALEWADHGRALLARTGGDLRTEGRLENARGVALLGVGDVDAAVEAAQRAVALEEKALGPDHIDLTRSLTALGNTLRTVGRFDEALAAHRRAIQIRQTLLDDAHPGIALSRNGIGRVLLSMGKIDEAIAEHLKAKDLLSRSGIEAPPLERLKTLALLGECYRAKQDHRQARAYWRDALQLASPILPPSHPVRATLQKDLGAEALADGDPVEAMAALGGALEGQWPPKDKAALTLQLAQAQLLGRKWKEALETSAGIDAAEGHWIAARAAWELKDSARAAREAGNAAAAFTSQKDTAHADEVKAWLKTHGAHRHR